MNGANTAINYNVTVAVLTLNALLLHGVVLPRVASRVGQPLFETSFG